MTNIAESFGGTLTGNVAGVTTENPCVPFMKLADESRSGVPPALRTKIVSRAAASQSNAFDTDCTDWMTGGVFPRLPVISAPKGVHSGENMKCIVSLTSVSIPGSSKRTTICAEPPGDMVAGMPETMTNGAAPLKYPALIVTGIEPVFVTVNVFVTGKLEDA